MPRSRLIAALASGACLILAPAVSAHGNPHGGPPGQSGTSQTPTPAPTAVTAPVTPVATPAPGNGKGNGHGNGNGNGKGGATTQSVAVQATQTTTTASATSSDAGPGNSANAPGHTKRTVDAVTQAATTTAAAVAAAVPAVAAAAAPVVSAAPAATPAAPAATAPAPATPAAPTPAPAGAGRAHRHPAGTGHRRTSPPSRARARGGAAAARRAAASRSIAGGVRSSATAAGGGVTGGVLASVRTSGGRGGLVGGLSGKSRRQYSSGNVLAQMAGKRVDLVPALIGNLVPLPVPDWSKPIIVLLLLVCIVLAVRAWRSARKARRLESKGRQLAADLDVMQAALVPAIPSRLGALRASVAYRPAEGPAAGGDFYDVFPLDGGRVAVIVGDVSGHGRAALARAAHMHYTLRAYVETGLDARSSLKLAGRVLGNEGDGLFTTVAIAVYDPHDATLTYATAGHPAPVVIDDTVIEPVYGAASPALGWGLPTGLRQTTLPFSQGARACFFSDGVTEARTSDGLLGRERLAQLICEAGTGVSATELLEHVRARATTVNDDMAACLIEAGEGVAMVDRRFEEFEVDAEQLAAGQGERFLTACGVSDAETLRAVGRARDVAQQMGVALIRVEYTPTGRSVVVDGATSLVLATPSLGATGPDGEPAGVRDGDPAQWAGRALPLRT